MFLTRIELKDDHYQVPRSKSLIARRLPPANKAKGGSAAKYIAGTSAALGGRDDLLDRRVEAGSRAELLAKKGLSMPGMPGGKHMTARFDGKSDPSVSCDKGFLYIDPLFLFSYHDSTFRSKGIIDCGKRFTSRVNRLDGRRRSPCSDDAATGCPVARRTKPAFPVSIGFPSFTVMALVTWVRYVCLVVIMHTRGVEVSVADTHSVQSTGFPVSKSLKP
jgi:hypothetical protein